MNTKQKLLSIYYFGITIFLTLTFFVIFSSSTYSYNNNQIFFTNNKTVLENKIMPSQPVSIKSSSIKLNAIMEQIDLTSDNAVGVPKKIANAGWLKTSPLPGAIGNSIIVGHYGFWNKGVKGAFNNVNKLKKGDKIYIENKNKEIITFVVSGSEIYNPDEEIPKIFYSTDGKAHLNLITCEGKWDTVSKSYSKRLVIFTDKE